MKIFVDNKPVEHDFAEGATTLEAALQHIQSKVCRQGQLVVGVRCDGQDVPTGAMSKTLQNHMDAYERLEITTGTTDQLVTEAMNQAATCLTETESACQQVATLLKQGNTVDAVETLGECLRIWQQIHDAVAKSIEILEIDPDEAMIEGATLIEVVGKPKATLVAVRDALKSHDYVLLADVLEYEFADVTDAWRSLIGKLQHEAEVLKNTSDG